MVLPPPTPFILMHAVVQYTVRAFVMDKHVFGHALSNATMTSADHRCFHASHGVCRRGAVALLALIALIMSQVLLRGRCTCVHGVRYMSFVII